MRCMLRASEAAADEREGRQAWRAGVSAVGVEGGVPASASDVRRKLRLQRHGSATCQPGDHMHAVSVLHTTLVQRVMLFKLPIPANHTQLLRLFTRTIQLYTDDTAAASDEMSAVCIADGASPACRSNTDSAEVGADQRTNGAAGGQLYT